MRDFNILWETSETITSNPNLHSMHNFNQTISDLQLQELPLIGCNYTWSNKRPQPSFSKLDRIFLSNHWTTLTTHLQYLSEIQTTTSDHTLLSLMIKRINNLISRSFHFEKHWLVSEEAWKVFHWTWHSIPLMIKIANNFVQKTDQVCKQMIY
jgi:hypothetical protein